MLEHATLHSSRILLEKRTDISLEEGVAPLVSGVVGVTGERVVQLATGGGQEVGGSLGEYLDCQRHDLLQHVGVVRVEAGVEVDPQHAHVVAVRQPHHLLPDVPHHALGHDPQVVGGVEADLGAVCEDDLGLSLSAVEEDDPDLTLGDLGDGVLVSLR